MACLTALVQPLSGDRSAKHLAVAQPLKLAAAEAHLHTGAHAALHVGGIPDLETGEFHGALPIPGGLSFLAFGDFDATVTGLDAFPRDEWPPVLARAHARSRSWSAPAARWRWPRSRSSSW